MGAWAVDAFGNDDACDWAYGLDEVDDLSLVAEALDAVFSSTGGYLEAGTASEALAAIEAIARLQGHWGERTGYSENVDAWVEKTRLEVPDDLAQKAHQAIDRILADSSELKELWLETDEYDEWVASVEDLRGRVRA
jgi:hypothetical protein